MGKKSKAMIEDLSRRKMLAVTAFRSLTAKTTQYVSDRLRLRLRLRLYNAFVRPVLLYNGGTWA